MLTPGSEDIKVTPPLSLQAASRLSPAITAELLSNGYGQSRKAKNKKTVSVHIRLLSYKHQTPQAVSPEDGAVSLRVGDFRFFGVEAAVDEDDVELCRGFLVVDEDRRLEELDDAARVVG